MKEKKYYSQIFCIVIGFSVFFGCTNEQEVINEKMIIGTWMQDTSYYYLEGIDTTTTEKFNSGVSDIILDAFGFSQDTLENWSFIRFLDPDTLEYLNFPSPSIDGKYGYRLNTNELNISGGIYNIEELTDSILILKNTHSGLTSVEEYVRVDPIKATHQFYFQEMDRINSIRRAQEDSIRALFDNLTEPDINAEFQNGTDEFYATFYKNVKYPTSARMNGTQGKVVLGFMVDEGGSIVNIIIKESLSPSCDKAALDALRIVSEQAKWNPALKNGQPILQAFDLPVQFKLTN